MIVGYARVSSRGQSLDVQREKLRAVPCDKIYEEKRSGRTLARPQLDACLDFVREGETLVVTRLDRLARSLVDLCAIVARLERQQVELRVLDQALDTSTPGGRLTFHILGAIAEFENELRRERQADGIAAAHRRGVRFGHAHRLTPVQVAQLRQARKDGLLIRQLMQRYGLSKASVYRYLALSQLAGEAEAAD
jgi:DNA invertase Pin-like site-specific DNA recombinase